MHRRDLLSTKQLVKLRAMFRRLLPQLLLIVTLLLAQLGGLTHGAIHSLADKARRTDQSQAIDFHCDLCDEYAQIGSPMGSAHLTFSRLADCETQHPFVFIPSISLTFIPFSARAPPYFA